MLVWEELANRIVGDELSVFVFAREIGLEEVVYRLLTGRVVGGKIRVGHICLGSEVKWDEGCEEEKTYAPYLYLTDMTIMP